LTSLDGFCQLDDVLNLYGDALAANPWLDQFGVPLQQVTPVKQGVAWWVVDSNGKALPAEIREAEGFILLAASGGRPVDLAATYDGSLLRPLAVVADGEWLSLAPAMEEAAR